MSNNKQSSIEFIIESLMSRNLYTKELLEEIYFSLTKDRILVRKKWVCRQLSADSYAHLIPKLEKAIEQLKKESKNE